MKTLVLDSATSATLVGLRLADGTVVERYAETQAGQRPTHTKAMLSLVHELLVESEEDIQAIERIVVGVGPGMYTGLRVGIATAQGLRAGLSKGQVVGVSTILSYYQRYQQQCAFVLLEARRGEVFFAGWLHENLAIKPQLVAVEDLPRLMGPVVTQAGETCFAYGHGAQKYAQHFAALDVVTPADRDAHLPSSQALLALADQQPVAPPLPQYLRDADVTLTAKEKSSV